MKKHLDTSLKIDRKKLKTMEKLQFKINIDDGFCAYDYVFTIDPDNEISIHDIVSAISDFIGTPIPEGIIIRKYDGEQKTFKN
jgi:hypothetical protein